MEKLGEGSGGVVYKAFHKRLRTPVVLKKILAEKQTEEYYRNEVDILKKLRHSIFPRFWISWSWRMGYTLS